MRVGSTHSVILSTASALALSIGLCSAAQPAHAQARPHVITITVNEHTYVLRVGHTITIRVPFYYHSTFGNRAMAGLSSQQSMRIDSVLESRAQYGSPVCGYGSVAVSSGFKYFNFEYKVVPTDAFWFTAKGTYNWAVFDLGSNGHDSGHITGPTNEEVSYYDDTHFVQTQYAGSGSVSANFSGSEYDGNCYGSTTATFSTT